MDRQSSEVPAIAIDNGSSTCRMGFCGDDAPTAVFPNCIGRPLFKADPQEFYVGDKAQNKRELLSLQYPVERGIVTDWDSMEKIWQYGFSELSASPSEHAVITSEPPLNPRAHSEKMAQVWFEKIGVPAFQLCYEPKSIFMGLGRDNRGILVNVGHGVIYVTAHYEGHGPISMERLDFGGQDLTNFLQDKLYQRGYCFTSSSEMEELTRIKEKTCLVLNSRPGNKEAAVIQDVGYTLSDGSTITLEAERYECTNVLFRPGGKCNTGLSVTNMVLRAIQEVCVSIRTDLQRQIVLSGGTTMCPGFREKLESELKSVLGPCVKVIAPPERKYALWIGLSIAAELTSFKHFFTSKDAYEEHGPNCLRGYWLSGEN